MTCPDRRRFSILIAAITPLALALALLFSTVQAQEGSAPDKPTGLSATASHDRVVLTWDDPDDDAITGYVILRRVRENDVGGEFSELVPDTGTAATTYTDDTVKAGTTYTYRIKAINEHGVSDRSRWFHIDTRAAPKPPDKPRGLSATASHDRAVLTWDDPGDDSITGYVILRRHRYDDPEGHFDELVADTGSAATTYTDDTVSAETHYTYRIKAINKYGVSERSRWFHIETPAAPEATFVEGDDQDEQGGEDDQDDPVGAPGQATKLQSQGNDPCPGGGSAPTPTAVEVEAVPIVVESTTAEYFVIYVRHDLDVETTVDLPVSVTLGGEGTTTLSENVEALPKERYRVEKYLVGDPADIDGDCIDDLTELADPVGMNPLNAAAVIDLSNGAVVIADRSTFDALSFSSSLGQQVVKFILFGMETDSPVVYFMNTKTYVAHRDFLDFLGIDPLQSGVVIGDITYYPQLIAPDGNPGVYVIYSDRRHPFSVVARVFTVLAASMPLLEDDLAYRMHNQRLQYAQHDLPSYRDSRIKLVFDTDVYPETQFLVLNQGEGYGLLRVMEADTRPHPRDIVIYEALPNELPRVAGIISTVPQTPLSHVNLRAVQDRVPNAFIRGALDRRGIDALIGSHVHFTVTENGWSIRAATRAEVDDHYASSRPAQDQIPQRDLLVTAIAPLSEIGFADSDAFGVKAANVAELATLGFPTGTVPDGFAIPFYFYDEFMKHNGLYARIQEMLADPDFHTDFDEQADDLKDLRKAIKDAETPSWIVEALTEMNAAFPEGTALRFRSSTNNEDLPGFNGAGLYDSKTQHPEETLEDGIDKSLKQVYASLWNFRAFVERDFYRIDHMAAAMGVLVHPNYSDELANGVAVSFDPIDGLDEYYYLNTQLGEDLVTNPGALSTPEEIRLHQSGGYIVLATSDQVPPGQLLMSDDHLSQLGRHLEVIHDYFEGLYNPAPDERFAMEIEFKITRENILAIKQARPWIFSADSPPPDDDGEPPGPSGAPSPPESSGPAGPPRPPAPPVPAGPAAPAPPPGVIGATAAAQAIELPGNRLLIQRHDLPDASFELTIGSITADCATTVMAGVIRDQTLGQTYIVVRREADGQIVRRWVPPDSPLVYQIPWAEVNTQYTVPVGVVVAIPMDDQCPQPNQLVRRFDGGDDRIFGYDAALGQWRHVPDIATFQALGFYWCNVTAADGAFFERITPGSPYPASPTPARGDYPNCLTS